MFFFGGGQLVQKTWVTQSVHFWMSYTGSCVAIDSCEVTCWTWPLGPLMISLTNSPNQHIESLHESPCFDHFFVCKKNICLLWCISFHSKQPALIQLILYTQQKQPLKTKSFPCTHHTITCVLAPFIPEEALAELPPSCPSSSCESSQNFEPLKIQQFPTKRSCFAVETQLWWINNLQCCDPSVFVPGVSQHQHFCKQKVQETLVFLHPLAL